MEMRKPRDRRATSPVIATVILVAVAITIAVAVSYWMGGITGQYTRFEKVEVTSAYCEYPTNLVAYGALTDADVGWVITLDFRNTGTTDATLDNVFVNSKKIDAYGTGGAVTFDRISAWNEIDTPPVITQLFIPANEKLICAPGEDATLYVVIQDAIGISFTSGTTVEVAIHTGAGNTYMKMVTLS